MGVVNRKLGVQVAADAEMKPVFRLTSGQRVPHDQCIGGWTINPGVIGAALPDLRVTASLIKADRRVIVGCDLQKSCCGAAFARGVMKPLQQAARQPFAAVVGMGGDGQHFGLVRDDAGQNESTRVAQCQAMRAVGKLCELRKAPWPVQHIGRCMDICHAGRIGQGVAVAVSCHRQAE